MTEVRHRIALRPDLVLTVFGLAIVLQIAYPLAAGRGQDQLTVAIVLSGAAAAVVHAGATRGPAAALALASASAGLGFLVEVIGVHTGFPFGAYRYGDVLGPAVWRVPLIVGPAWTMTAWPAAVVARRLASSYRLRVLIGALALAAWDLALDPQMVAAHRWTWTSVGAHLPGVPDIPISNYLGWLLVSLVISALLVPVVDRQPGADAVPAGYYVWVCASSVLLLAVFAARPAAALWAAVGMGPFAVAVVRTWPRPA